MDWNELTMAERAKLIKTYVKNGVYDLSEMKEHYNSVQKPPSRPDNIKPDFVRRLEDPNRKSIPDWANPDNIATHKMSWATEDNHAVVYPNVQNIDGKLVDYTRPPYSQWAGYDSAVQRGDTLHMKPKQADWWTTHYKMLYPNFHAYGGSTSPIKPPEMGGELKQQHNQRVYNADQKLQYDNWYDSLTDEQKQAVNNYINKINTRNEALSSAGQLNYDILSYYFGNKIPNMSSIGKIMDLSDLVYSGNQLINSGINNDYSYNGLIAPFGNAAENAVGFMDNKIGETFDALEVLQDVYEYGDALKKSYDAGKKYTETKRNMPQNGPNGVTSREKAEKENELKQMKFNYWTMNPTRP